MPTAWGLSLGEADLLRRDLAKGDAQGASLWQERFLQGAQSRGLSRKAAQELFGSIVQFSGYAFNKAHSVSYALIAWRAAYLKAHYPEVFYAVLLRRRRPKPRELSSWRPNPWVWRSCPQRAPLPAQNGPGG